MIVERGGKKPQVSVSGHEAGLRPIGAYLPLFPSPNATFMPPFAVGQGMHGLAVLAMRARWIPDALDAVDDCRDNGVNGGDTPEGESPIHCSAPAAATSLAPAHSTSNGLPPPSRVRWWRSTGYAARSLCFHATPRQCAAPGPSLPHWCDACCVSGCAAAMASFFSRVAK